MTADDTLGRLADVIASRRGGDPDRSYVARLFAKGEDAMLKKVGEEATELVLAAKDAARDATAVHRLVAETADLWFHTLIVLAAHGLRPDDVLAELRLREGLSGLEEFARRGAADAAGPAADIAAAAEAAAGSAAAVPSAAAAQAASPAPAISRDRGRPEP